MAEKAKVQKEKLRRLLTGVVVGMSSANTVKVKVERKFPHPKYGKIIKTHKSYLVDNKNAVEVEKGDKVTIGEIKPVSRRKSWEIIGKVK